MFTNKTVLVTGASSGIGKAQALLFLKNNAHVIGFDKQKSSISHAHYTHFEGDVGNPSDVAKLPQSVDILLNSAGVLDDYKPNHETDYALWQQILQTNTTGMFLVTSHILPFMRSQKSGIIINMASIAGFLAGGGGVAYTTSKHAVIGYTKQLAYDYAKDNIKINAIAPGAIQTNMTKKDFEGAGEMAQWVAEQTPIKRWGQAEEIAQATLFLASAQSSFIQGHVLTIDGGWSIQ